MEKKMSCINVNDRDYTLDVAKTILIFLVVWGHVIQYMHGIDYDYWEDPIFKFIYGFHMPLFALISGYLMKGTFKKYGSVGIIRRRAKQLLLPTVGWAVILTLLDIVINLFTHERVTVIWIIQRCWTRISHDLWFLKAMFLTCAIVVLVEKFCKGYWLIYIACWLLTITVPSIYNFNLYGYVLPFFILGYKMGEIIKECINSYNLKGKAFLFVVSLILYAFLLQFFHENNYVYTTGLNVIHSELGAVTQLGIDFYRWLVAFVGCIMVLSASTLFTRKLDVIITISNSTQIIYVVTAVFFTYLPQLLSRVGMRSLFGSVPSAIVNVCMFVPVSILLMLIAFLLKKIIMKIKLNKILLGKW